MFRILPAGFLFLVIFSPAVVDAKTKSVNPMEGNTASSPVSLNAVGVSANEKDFQWPAIQFVEQTTTHWNAYRLTDIRIAIARYPETNSVGARISYVEEGNNYDHDGGWDTTPRDFVMELYSGNTWLMEVKGPSWVINCHIDAPVTGASTPIRYDFFDHIDRIVIPSLHGHSAACGGRWPHTAAMAKKS
jgi:hypothetical protein